MIGPRPAVYDAAVDASDFIAEWEGFYVAATGAAAVLLGLVFVGLSLHFERNRDQTRFKGLAIQSAVSLFYAVLVSLVMLVPGGRPIIQAVAASVLGLFGTWTSLVALVDARRGGATPLSLTFRFILPLVAMLALLGAAVALAIERELGVWLVAGVVFLHILIGTQNAWDLFLGAGATGPTPGADAST